MRKGRLWLVAALALPLPQVASAQDPGGGGGPSDTSPQGPITGSLPVREMSAPGGGMLLPNSSADVTRRVDMQRNARNEVHAVAEQRREQALAQAKRVAAGATVPPDLVAKVREALARDIELWRAEYDVDERDLKAMKARWIRDAGALSAQDWVLWRAAWFEERDKWLSAKSKVTAR